ncbi:3-dehydroquinate synthase [Nostocaceae cyanobacterium CENA369]|uniref:3-dehydroquinate synthase n=1 Tax=Dendronalium phyllosphericum CENA369 TaxID=1725256 RepID=A0A8J7LB75_9NOST|nr:3-dehydroquinate synthase [Dendronalium phyllosphericum]MBH8571627.1 3-dehydroquinate synthase [Dendronalium phyllosphericum CENA369]
MKTSLKQNLAINFQPISQCVRVSFNYDVHFTRGLFKLDNSLLAQAIAADGHSAAKPVVAVIDGGLLQYQDKLLEKLLAYAQRYQDVFTLSSEPIIVPGGETVKNDSRFIEQIHQSINLGGLCRHSYVLAIGGGAVLDMAGYAATTAHRGIRLLRVPTTVLAQNDSGVGVKNGINAFGKKNFLGTFMPPYAVLNDFDFLTTLDDRDWRSGIAEAVKVALIKDRNFFDFIQTYAEKLANRDMDIMERLIYRCSQLHLEHIAGSGDPFEMGSSRPLDFGHWAAHKLEHLTNYSLRHGEAVAIGIALDSTYSYLTGQLLRSHWQQILTTLKILGFALYLPTLTEQLDRPDHPHCLFRGLTEFREHLGGELTITLLQGIGQGIEVHKVDLSLYRQAILMLQDWELSSVLSN